ncbi:MAG: hypothetical protein QFC55_07590 [Chloroflexota bacterium]|nr:hypothetical protein [Chloroflexota bacterium]
MHDPQHSGFPTQPTSGWSPPQISSAQWGSPPPAPPRSRRNLWIVAGVVALLLVLAVGSCALLLKDVGDMLTPGLKVVQGSGGQIDSVHVNNFNGHTTITFQAAIGIDFSDGPSLACNVVRPALATTAARDTAWVIVNRAGDMIASNETPC